MHSRGSIPTGDDDDDAPTNWVDVGTRGSRQQLGWHNLAGNSPADSLVGNWRLGVHLSMDLPYQIFVEIKIEINNSTLKLMACWCDVEFRVIDSPDVFNKLFNSAWLTGSWLTGLAALECNRFDFSSETESEVSRWRFRSRRERWSGRSISSVINVNGDPGWYDSIWGGLF